MFIKVEEELEKNKQKKEYSKTGLFSWHVKIDTLSNKTNMENCNCL